MDTALTSLRLHALARSPRAVRVVAGCRAAATAFYFHALPHPLADVLYWDALYVGLRAIELARAAATRRRRQRAVAHDGAVAARTLRTTPGVVRWISL